MMSKLKILFPVGTLYPNESGGVSLSLYWLLAGLYTTGKIDLTTITSSHGIKYGTIEEDTWLDTHYGRVIYLKTSNIHFGLPIIRNFLKKITDCDIVHLSSFFYFPSIICFFISFFFQKSIVWSTRGSLDDIEFKKKGLLKRMVIIVLRPFIKKVTFHTTSREETDFVRKNIGVNTKIIQITNFVVIPQKYETNKEHYFLYIGRFHPKKGIDNLLNALKISAFFENSKFKLKIAGNYSNNYGNYIRRLYEELNLVNKVEFLGSVNGLDKQILLAKAYFVFMPSYSENFGISTVEALSQGTPVVASIYTPWESLIRYKAGFWVDNTPDVLKEVIDKIITMDSNEYAAYTTNTRLLVSKELDIIYNINIWLNFYNSLNT
jgi:glycosyltransferase involved in cell wall biosynthesis